MSFSLRYRVTGQVLRHPDVGEYRSYGIDLYRMCNRRDTVVERLPDISTSQSFARELARRLNQGQVEQVHFRDVVEDMLP